MAVVQMVWCQPRACGCVYCLLFASLLPWAALPALKYTTTPCKGLELRPVPNTRNCTAGSPTRQTKYSWVGPLGYMSGVNIRSMAAGQGFRDLGAKDSDEMTSFLRHYCDAHPLATYLAGVLELMDSLPLIPYQK